MHQEGALNDYILVKFETEKMLGFHVVQIMVVHEEEYHVLFMRKTIGKINKITFSFPKEVDAALIRKNHAILVLPPPILSRPKRQF